MRVSLCLVLFANCSNHGMREHRAVEDVDVFAVLGDRGRKPGMFTPVSANVHWHIVAVAMNRSVPELIVNLDQGHLGLKSATQLTMRCMACASASSDVAVERRKNGDRP